MIIIINMNSHMKLWTAHSRRLVIKQITRKFCLHSFLFLFFGFFSLPAMLRRNALENRPRISFSCQFRAWRSNEKKWASKVVEHKWIIKLSVYFLQVLLSLLSGSLALEALLIGLHFFGCKRLSLEDKGLGLHVGMLYKSSEWRGMVAQW